MIRCYSYLLYTIHLEETWKLFAAKLRPVITDAVNRHAIFVTVHGKTNKKVMTRARVHATAR